MTVQIVLPEEYKQYMRADKDIDLALERLRTAIRGQSEVWSNMRDRHFNASRVLVEQNTALIDKIERLETVAEEAKKLCKVLEDLIDGDFKPGSFTLNPLQIALHAAGYISTSPIQVSLHDKGYWRE